MLSVLLITSATKPLDIGSDLYRNDVFHTERFLSYFRHRGLAHPFFSIRPTSRHHSKASKNAPSRSVLFYNHELGGPVLCSRCESFKHETKQLYASPTPDIKREIPAMTPVEWVDTPLLDHIRKILLSIHMFQASSSYLSIHFAELFFDKVGDYANVLSHTFASHPFLR